MVYHYCKIALRTIQREKLRSLFSIAGLAAGLSSSFLLLIYLQYELHYDRELPDVKDTYRIATAYTMQKTVRRCAVTFGGLAAELSENVPEVISAARIMPMLMPDQLYAAADRRNVPIAKPFAVDPGIIEIFGISFLRGDPASALSDPAGCILGEDLAAGLFGDRDPLGKTIILQNNRAYTITGVAANPPGHSHFQFDMLMSVQAMERLVGWPAQYEAKWSDLSTWVYIQTKDGTDLPLLQQTINGILSKNIARGLYQNTSVFLQRIDTIYLHSGLDAEIGPSGNSTTIYAFSALCLILLFISILNYLNISVSRSLTRLHTVGKRYTLGARRKDIFLQFTMESIVFAFLALFPAILFTHAAYPLMNQTLHTGSSPPSITNLPALLLTLFLTLLIGIAAGIYPALIISRVNLAALCKGLPAPADGRHRIRGAVAVVQLLFTLFFINCTLIVARQVHYLRIRELGFDSRNIILLSLNRDSGPDRTKQLKEALLQLPGISGATVSSSIPGMTESRFVGLMLDDRPLEQPIHFICTDADFLSTYSLQLQSGRFLDGKEERGIQAGFVLNEAAAAMMGLAHPLGHRITRGEQSGPVVGVVKDFHFQSLHESIKPLIICPSWNRSHHLSIKLDTTISQRMGASIENVWGRIYPMQPITLTFLDETIDRLYEAEERTHRLFFAGAAIAILLSVIGLFGLSDLQLEQRTREIGIRKILGGSPAHMFVLLYRQYLLWTGAAAVLAGPPAFLLMRRWLNNFAYAVGIPGWIYLLSTGLACTIILLTISRHIARIYLLNPVETLREH
ncbi:ABC transporter permease [bacterium]|nr:ABC transporter permease [bacterium]